jgi:hypothetical protein
MKNPSSENLGIHLWLDDIRDPVDYGMSDEDFVWIKNYSEAVKLIETGRVTWISFDHDLGEEKTGYDIAKYIEEKVYSGAIKCPEWKIHSGNPVGRANIELAMRSAKRFCDFP